MNLGGFDYVEYNDVVKLQSTKDIVLAQITAIANIKHYQRPQPSVNPIRKHNIEQFKYLNDINFDWSVFMQRFNKINQHIVSILRQLPKTPEVNAVFYKYT